MFYKIILIGPTINNKQFKAKGKTPSSQMYQLMKQKLLSVCWYRGWDDGGNLIIILKRFPPRRILPNSTFITILQFDRI